MLPCSRVRKSCAPFALISAVQAIFSVDLEEINVQAFIGAKLLSSKVAQPTKKPFEIYDSRLSGFTLRVQPTGVRSYYSRFGRSRRIALGKVGTLLPDEAREKCQKVLGNVAHGRHPLHGLSGVADVLRALEHDADELQSRDEASRTAAQSADIASQRYVVGGISELALLEAQRQALQAILDRVKVQAQRYADTAALYEALGAQA